MKEMDWWSNLSITDKLHFIRTYYPQLKNSTDNLTIDHIKLIFEKQKEACLVNS